MTEKSGIKKKGLWMKISDYLDYKQNLLQKENEGGRIYSEKCGKYLFHPIFNWMRSTTRPAMFSSVTVWSPCQPGVLFSSIT